MAIRDCTSRPPSAEYEAGFEAAFPGKSMGKHLARHCGACGRLPAWCECALKCVDVPVQAEEQRPPKSPGQARWPMVVVK